MTRRPARLENARRRRQHPMRREPVTAAELRALRREIERRMPPRARAGTRDRTSRAARRGVEGCPEGHAACAGTRRPTTCSDRLRSWC